MVHRHTIPGQDYDIAVTTEQRPDGLWAAVASVLRVTEDGGRSVTPLPTTGITYPTEAEAEETAVRAAEHWISENAPES